LLLTNEIQNLMMTGLTPDAVTVALRDANQVANVLPVVEHDLESVQLGTQKEA
jgi:type 2A phosphatase activator TIP41